MELRIRQVPVIRGSSLQLYAPAWTKGYYSSNGTLANVELEDGVIHVAHRANKGVDFEGTEEIRVIDKSHVQVTFTGILKSDVQAKMEWSIGYVNAFAAPRIISTTNQAVELSGALGKIDLKVNQGKLALLDGRVETSRGWTREIPTLWLGLLGEDVPVGRVFKYVATIEYDPAPKIEPATDLSVKLAAKHIDDAFVPQPKQIQVIPTPKQLSFTGGRFELAPKMQLIVASEDARRGAQQIARDLRERFGWDWSILGPKDPVDERLKQISLSLQTHHQKPEGYLIDCTGDSLTLSATDPAGYFYAAQTLSQLISIDGAGPLVPTCAVRDWPSLAFRGVHIFPGRGAMDLHRRLLERIFARFKLNNVVLQCESAEWETNPKLWTNISVSKSDLREYARIARGNFIAPTPLVQSLGHVEWMFKNGQNRDLAEDPAACWAYDATNPATYKFIEKIYDETIEIFHPKFFHIGHDEVTMRGEYPHRESSKKIGTAQLFANDVKKLDAYFRPKNIRMMLWGDMMLTRDESNDAAANADYAAHAKLMRDAVPRYAIICDWHYQPATEYQSLKLFNDEGLQTLASTWYNPANISSFAKYTQKLGALGLLQTTWAGFNIDEVAMQKEFKQFSAYVLAAEYAWNADAPPPEQLTWDADTVFAAAFNPTPILTHRRGGDVIDLTQATTLPLDFHFPLTQRCNGVRFVFEDFRGVALAGALSRQPLPSKATFEIDMRADQVVFLHATLNPAKPGEEVGMYEIMFRDDTIERIPLRYADNIRSLDDSAVTVNAAPWSEKAPRRLRLMTWTNPRPGRYIRSITFSTKHPYASPMLVGMTAIHAAEAK